MVIVTIQIWKLLYFQTVVAQQILTHKIHLARNQAINSQNPSSKHYGFCPQFLTPNNMPSFGPRISVCYLCSQPLKAGESIDEHLRQSHFAKQRLSVHTVTAGHMILWRTLLELGVCTDLNFAATCMQLAQRATEQVGTLIQKSQQANVERIPMLDIDRIQLESINYFRDQWEKNNCDQFSTPV